MINDNKELVSLLVKSFVEDYNDWVFGTYTVDNVKNGISVWTYNGKSSTDISRPLEIRFGFFERRKINKAIEQCKRLQLLSINSKKND